MSGIESIIGLIITTASGVDAFNWIYVGKHTVNLAILLGVLAYFLKAPIRNFLIERRVIMSSKIEELIANEELREKLSCNGRESALHWRIENFIDDTIKLYHTLLGLGTTSTKTVTKENYRRPHIGQLD